MDNPEPRALYLNAVLRNIDRTVLRIPRFQRHFVWTERDVLDLLDSIKHGYPIGSILTWKVDRNSNYFAGYREHTFPSADPELSTFEVILDGAQRLSSLYGCLRNPGRNDTYRVGYDTRAQEFQHISETGSDPWVVPMSALFDSRQFLDVQKHLMDLVDSPTPLQRALDLYSTFQEYQIPIIALSSDDIADVVEVFRRVNSSGTSLSSVDFVRALTWKSSFDLEDLYERFASRYQATPLEGFSEDFLVRCLAITADLSLDAREVVRLREVADDADALESQIDQIEHALDQMSGVLGGLEIAGANEIPYDVQRLVLFSLMHYDAAVGQQRIEKWFWCSTFAEEHQSKPESYTSRLIREIRVGNPSAALEVRKSVDPGLLVKRPRRAGTAVTLGFDLLLRRLGARSLISGQPTSTADVLHGALYAKAELDAGFTGASPPVRALANLVLLTPGDAEEWNDLRASSSLTDAFELCDRRTGDATAIWRSQGLTGDLARATESLLQTRSRALLGQVVAL
jgi:hypothetical protein